MASTYSIRLTRGAYVVSAEDAERILRSIEERDAHVLVNADSVGDGLYRTPVRLITAHVMSIAENVGTLDDVEVAPLRRPSLRAIRT